MGRRKISIAPIADDRNRSVTFQKRKSGLFKKAYELGILCSADVAVVVFSNTGKLFEFHSGDMDQILLRYSHYQGPAHEKKGPEDYASKDVEEIAKLGLGGKMTIREERMLANGDDDDDDDDSGAEEKKPVTKGGAKGKSTRQTSVKSDRSSMEAAEDHGLPLFSSDSQLPRVLPQPNLSPQLPPIQYQLPFPQQQPGQGFNPYGGSFPMPLPGQPGSMPGWPAFPSPNGFPGQMGRLPNGQPQQPGQQWGMNPAQLAQAQAHAWAAVGGQGSPPPPLPPGQQGPPDFAALQASLFASGGGMPYFGGMNAGVPGYSPFTHAMQQQQHAMQQQQQQMQQQQQQQMHQQQHRQSPPEDASPINSLVEALSRPPSVDHQSLNRSNSSKPRLSVNIPSPGSGGPSRQSSMNGGGGGNNGSVLNNGNEGQEFTEEPEGLDDDDGDRTAHPSNAHRFANDLLPSPSNFLTDVDYNAGFSLSALNSSIPLSNDDPRGTVFAWPTSSKSVQSDQQQQQQQQQGNGYRTAPMLNPEDSPDLFGLSNGGEQSGEHVVRSLKRGSEGHSPPGEMDVEDGSEGNKKTRR